MKNTKYKDIDGKEIHEGDHLIDTESLREPPIIYTVKWSDFRQMFIGDNKDEIYEVSPSVFNRFRIVTISEEK